MLNAVAILSGVPGTRPDLVPLPLPFSSEGVGEVSLLHKSRVMSAASDSDARLSAQVAVLSGTRRDVQAGYCCATCRGNCSCHPSGLHQP